MITYEYKNCKTGQKVTMQHPTYRAAEAAKADVIANQGWYKDAAMVVINER